MKDWKSWLIRKLEEKELINQYLREGKTAKEIEELIPGVKFVNPI